MRRTVPPSAEFEAQIDALLAVGVGENPRESLSELAKLGARLIIQRAVEEEFDAWLGRARLSTTLASARSCRVTASFRVAAALPAGADQAPA
jgi:putative transposase